ncbi:MAG: RNA polymerase sigma factor [Armatimonadota bacterium]
MRIVRERCSSGAQIEPEELEHLADLLLRVYGPDPQYPIRSDLRERAVPVHSLDDGDDPVAREARGRAAPPPGASPPLQALIARLLVAANLRSPRQRAVARLYLWGYSLREVARALGIPYSTAASRWRCARAHLRRALDAVSIDDLLSRVGGAGIPTEAVAEVFRAEQCKSLYRPPRHCPAGRERCRRTGICAYRNQQCVGTAHTQKEQ